MKRITQTKEIKSGNESGVIFSGLERASYKNTFQFEEYLSNDLVTFSIAAEIASRFFTSDIQIAYAGPSAPLPSQGNNGDLYFIVPNDSSYVELRQKINGSWVAVFTVPLVTTSITTITKTQSDLTDDGYGGYILKIDLPNGGEISSISIRSGTVITRLDTSLATTDISTTPNTTISGFPNNATQTITLKFI